MSKQQIILCIAILLIVLLIALPMILFALKVVIGVLLIAYVVYSLSGYLKNKLRK